MAALYAKTTDGARKKTGNTAAASKRKKVTSK
jgi:hypothetical protein